MVVDVITLDLQGNALDQLKQVDQMLEDLRDGSVNVNANVNMQGTAGTATGGRRVAGGAAARGSGVNVADEGAIGSLSNTLRSSLPTFLTLAGATAGLTGAVRLIGGSFFDRITSLRSLTGAFININDTIGASEDSLNRFSRTLSGNTLRNLENIDGRSRVLFLNLGSDAQEFVQRYTRDLALISTLTEEQAMEILTLASAGELSVDSQTRLAESLGITNTRLQEIITEGATFEESFGGYIETAISNSDDFTQALSEGREAFRQLGIDFRNSDIGETTDDLFGSISGDFGSAFGTEIASAVRSTLEAFGILEQDPNIETERQRQEREDAENAIEQEVLGLDDAAYFIFNRQREVDRAIAEQRGITYGEYVRQTYEPGDIAYDAISEQLTPNEIFNPLFRPPPRDTDVEQLLNLIDNFQMEQQRDQEEEDSLPTNNRNTNTFIIELDGEAVRSTVREVDNANLRGTIRPE